jgi:hypothetical protein
VGLLVELLDLAVLFQPRFVAHVLQVELRQVLDYSFGFADGKAMRAAEALVAILRYFYAT